MDLNELKTFIAIVELQSFSAAGLKLNISQPAVSKRISHLEQIIGSPILDRHDRRIKPTDVGTILYDGAVRIIRDIENTLTEIRNLDRVVNGSVEIASSHYAGIYYLPERLKLFGERYPRVEHSIEFVTSKKALQLVQDSQVEIALCTLPGHIPEMIGATRIVREELHVVTGRDHPLAKKDKVSVGDLSSFTAVLPRRGNFILEQLDNVVRDHGLLINKPVWSDSLITAQAMIKTGLGWGLLPSIMLNMDVKTLSLDLPMLYRDIGLLINKRRIMSRAATEFTRFWQAI